MWKDSTALREWENVIAIELLLVPNISGKGVITPLRSLKLQTIFLLLYRKINKRLPLSADEIFFTFKATSANNQFWNRLWLTKLIISANFVQKISIYESWTMALSCSNCIGRELVKKFTERWPLEETQPMPLSFSAVLGEWHHLPATTPQPRNQAQENYAGTKDPSQLTLGLRNSTRGPCLVSDASITIYLRF